MTEPREVTATDLAVSYLPILGIERIELDKSTLNCKRYGICNIDNTAVPPYIYRPRPCLSCNPP